ncbi:MAG TPA: hypothetical protein PKN04_03775 [bacterium]|jgi:putative lipoprotein|nr:hypothetical protein [bacterium]HNT64876.1 hypothetical protein [bacterium]HOX84956.1 hypothetical protein [bacterium]HPG44178.1 hypothetical protein [bacterium]HPM96545.1 hypothetical protein [bacterium]
MQHFLRTFIAVLVFSSSGFSQTAVDSLRLPLAKTKKFDAWFAKDKADHLIASSFLVGLGYYAAKQELDRSHPAACNSAVVFSLSLGIAKELYDGTSKTGTPSWKDLVADMAGIGLAYALISVGKD